MKVRKEKQYLIFDFGDKSCVKYNLQTNECIGKSGNVVKSLCSQLRGITIQDIIDSCEDKNYGKFLEFIYDDNYNIKNIGTILNKVKDYPNLEQFFSAGIYNASQYLEYSITDIPKSLIKLYKSGSISILDNEVIEIYKGNLDICNLAYNLNYSTLRDEDLYSLLFEYKSFFDLITYYRYNAKSLLQYLDYLITYEALSFRVIIELKDYARMMNKISSKFDKYPKHFLTTHAIACRNYKRLRESFDESKFLTRINKDMEVTFGRYCFIYPKSTQEIKDEAVSQNNCVSSYIKDVINGECDILFLRKKDNPAKSLVTIEVRNGQIVQAKRKFNYDCTKEQEEVINRWNDWYKNKLK